MDYPTCRIEAVGPCADVILRTDRAIERIHCTSLEGKTLCFHADSSVEESDSITQWSGQRDLASGKVSVRTFDFKDPKPQSAQTQTRNEQGAVSSAGAYAF